MKSHQLSLSYSPGTELYCSFGRWAGPGLQAEKSYQATGGEKAVTSNGEQWPASSALCGPELAEGSALHSKPVFHCYLTMEGDDSAWPLGGCPGLKHLSQLSGPEEV